jgi:hypothetical protein
MSHFTTIKTQIKDIDALRSAVQEMGLSLLQKTTARGYTRKQDGRTVVRTWLGEEVSRDVQVNGNVITFNRNGMTFRGTKRRESTLSRWKKWVRVPSGLGYR